MFPLCVNITTLQWRWTSSERQCETIHVKNVFKWRPSTTVGHTHTHSGYCRSETFNVNVWFEKHKVATSLLLCVSLDVMDKAGTWRRDARSIYLQPLTTFSCPCIGCHTRSVETFWHTLTLAAIYPEVCQRAGRLAARWLWIFPQDNCRHFSATHTDFL